MLKRFFFFSLFFCHSLASFEFTILHTNDLHSHLEGSFVKESEHVIKRGGYAELAFQIKRIRKDLEKKGEVVLLFDAGDFYGGTLFHSLALQANAPYFPEYEFFNTLNYDAITLGNHEFDGGDEGFDLLMRKVIKLGNKIPIISTNYINQSRYPIIKSKIIEKVFKGEKIKFGILGALGPNGCAVSKGNRKNNHFIGYSDDDHDEEWSELEGVLIKEARELKKKGAEVNILVLHGGSGEDDRLARKLKGIDVIIAGHTHEIYQKKIGQTYISQAGSYAKSLGVLPFRLKKELYLREPVIAKGGYHLKLGKDAPKDSESAQKILFYKRGIKKILKENGLPEGLEKFKANKNLDRLKTGRFLTQRILDEMNERGESIDFYFSAAGLIRGEFFKEVQYDVYDLFRLLPIGLGRGGRLGHSVVSFYLSKEDVIKLIDFLETYSKFASLATPIYSENVTIERRSWGVPFLNRVKSVQINGREIKGLNKVATNTFIFNYLDLIKKKTFGLVSLVIRDNKGEPLDDREVKEHKSEVFYYLHSFQ